MTRRADLPVEGMTCAACATRIGRGLGRLDGVDRADVNLAANRATVVFDEALVDEDALRATIERLGYTVPDLDDAAGIEERVRRTLERRLVLAAVLTVPLVAVSMVPPLMFDGWQWLAAVLATPVVLVSGAGFHRSAWLNLRHGNTTMDSLVSLGTLSAWGWSMVALLALDAASTSGMGSMPGMPGMADDGSATEGAHVYFETAGVIITLILLGKWFEVRAKRRSSAALRALAELGARTARLVDGREVPLDDLAVGMRFVVRPGERIPTDGVVVEGRAAVDRSLVTGEPVPEEVGPGDEVIGATVNADGRLVVEATRVGADTALAQIVRLVEEAQGSTAPVQRLADRISAVFVPIVLVIAAATLAGWLLTGHDADQSFTAAVAVLIIACPCALGLATPTAIMVGTGRAAQLGIVIKGGEVLESTHAVDPVVLDKPGTLTEGRMALVDVVAAAGSTTAEVLRTAGSLEAGSAHPIARAVAEAAPELDAVQELRDLPGRGVLGRVADRPVAVGRRALFAHLPDELERAATAAEATGRTAVLVGWAAADAPLDAPLSATGVLVVADRVKPTSAQAVATLDAMGLEVALLTGDHRRTAEAVAAEVGIHRVIADVLPEDKAAEIERLRAEGRVVAMVGDGVNDAPALALADLGIAIGTGADVAVEASDLTIVSGDPRAVADAIAIARRTLATIKGNLFWAFAYNTAAIPLAAAGLLDPMIAAGAMGFSSVFVVSNSLRLRRFRGARTPVPGAPRPVPEGASS